MFIGGSVAVTISARRRELRCGHFDAAAAHMTSGNHCICRRIIAAVVRVLYGVHRIGRVALHQTQCRFATFAAARTKLIGEFEAQTRCVLRSVHLGFFSKWN